MENSTYEKGTFAEEIAKMFAGRRAPAPTQIELKAYWETLEAFPLEVVVTAIRRVRITQPGTFCPSEADIHRAALKVGKELRERQDNDRRQRLLAEPVRPWTEAEAAEARLLLTRLRMNLNEDEDDWFVPVGAALATSVRT